MAFEINAPQPKFFEGLSAIGQSLKQNQLESNRQAAFADAQQGIPLSQIASRLGQIGDIEGATTFARLAEAQAQHAASLEFQKSQLAESSRHNTATEALQRQTLEEKPQFKEVQGLTGTKIIRIEPSGATKEVFDSNAPSTTPPPAATVVPGATPAETVHTPTAPAVKPPAASGTPATLSPEGRNENFLSTLDPRAQALIKKIADYEIDPKTLSIKGGHREQILSAVSAYDPGYDQKNYGKYAGGLVKFSTGPQGNAVRSLNTAIAHLETIDELGRALNNGTFQPGNAIYNRAREIFGSSLPTNLDAAKGIVGMEVIKAIVANGGGEREREESARQFSAVKSWEQLSGVTQTYRKLFGGQIIGLRRQYEDATGRKNFDTLLTPETKNAIALAEGKGKTTAGSETLKTFASPEDVRIAVNKGILKKGDTFLDSAGNKRIVQ